MYLPTARIYLRPTINNIMVAKIGMRWWKNSYRISFLTHQLYSTQIIYTIIRIDVRVSGALIIRFFLSVFISSASPWRCHSWSSTSSWSWLLLGILISYHKGSRESFTFVREVISSSNSISACLERKFTSQNCTQGNFFKVSVITHAQDAQSIHDTGYVFFIV